MANGDVFLEKLIAFFAIKNVAPPLIKASDTDREKSYLYSLPPKPINVYAFNVYSTDIATLTPKNVGVKRVQCTVRHSSDQEAYNRIFALFQFLCQRPEFIEEIEDGWWVIFDVRKGPVPLGQDEEGNYCWALSFPVKTRLF